MSDSELAVNAEKRLILIGGVSGSGKSTALKALQDMGVFCVDNLPTVLLGSFADFLISEKSAGGVSGELQAAVKKQKQDFALLLDCNRVPDFAVVSDALFRLKRASVEVLIFYFDCQDDVIVRRFRETRRPHPLLLGNASNVTILEAIRQEREMLASFRGLATRIFETSAFSPHELRQAIEDELQFSRKLRVVIQSFGFKYGLPHDSDLVVDVRFLPNPYFESDLTAQTGHDKKVQNYVLNNPVAEEFVKHYEALLRFLIPLYIKEGKRYLTVSVGCTGGKHRSVAITEVLCGKLKDLDVQLVLRDRDLNLS